MAKLKADWLTEAKQLGLDVTSKDKVADIKEAVENASSTKDTPKIAKAGKRSKKGLVEAKTKAEKEARKKGDANSKEAIDTDEPEKAGREIKKGPIPVARPKIDRQSKRYKAAATKIDKSKEYNVAEGLKLALETAKVNFDPTLELHVRLNADPKQADQNIRETVVLPSGTGKTVRVAVLAESGDQKKAKEAGADVVGEKDLLDAIGKDNIDFDVLIATPQMMGQLGRFAKSLGPKGLMPNPKSGTVAKNVASAVKQAKAGRVEFRIDKQGIVHIPAGKASFGQDKLMANLLAILDILKSAKPASIKGQFVFSAYLTTSMGPSVKLSVSELFNLPKDK